MSVTSCKRTARWGKREHERTYFDVFRRPCLFRHPFIRMGINGCA
ncbi:hypothetical protein SPAB_00100 [Salmonella enterica subsp. enterica serovar Paratyphi B str. SPB7]|uniref:Uncharacterized protein n=1 Tax=Salmonella paratyphi B (strain ATCC BAA-1250 / SPB7) TaxID=1016998 RepID=A0A6C6YWU7_SALPB|nr:hypothetical protein SPAB_00100 [Salmonella enterica subsp. enterica serovar Paratyphi B str. SPB7]